MAATADVDAAVDGDDAAGSWPPASGLSTAQTAATTAPVERPTKQLVLVPLPSAAQACLLKTFKSAWERGVIYFRVRSVELEDTRSYSLRSQMVTSKQPKLGLTLELFFSRISESTTGYTFTPCVGYFTSLGTDTR